MSDLSLFLGQFIRRPGEIRAIAPTARATAREMARPVLASMRRVAEIGAGTGTITRAILDTGLPPERLDIYELNPAFCTRLRHLFPHSPVHNRPAQAMAEDGPFDAVVSGVPVLALPDPMQAEIIGAAFAAMRPGAPFVQITYGPTPPVSDRVRAQFGLSFTRSRRIWANLPPAQVYVFRQTSAC